jgi:16S rRNA (guanine(527)-N(7))-methyltransferase RsmG
MVCAKEMQRLLDKFSILAGSDEGIKLKAYYNLLKKWNAHIDLTASNSWSVLGPLFEEAIWASRFYSSNPAKHLDIGSGAGFPAIPIRIMAAQMKLELVESREKRAIFLENVARELDLGAVQVHQERLETFLEKGEKSWDAFSWKAIKLSNKEFLKLIQCAHHDTEFWMFHGKRLPVEEEDIVGQKLEVVCKRQCPDRNEWKLSIYRVKSGDVSRETIF